MGDDEAPAIQHKMRRHFVEEGDIIAYPGNPLFLWKRVDLCDALSQAVANLHLLAPQTAQQFIIVVARHAKGLTGHHHTPRQRNRLDNLRPAIDEIAHEDDPPTLRV